MTCLRVLYTWLVGRQAHCPIAPPQRSGPTRFNRLVDGGERWRGRRRLQVAVASEWTWLRSRRSGKSASIDDRVVGSEGSAQWQAVHYPDVKEVPVDSLLEEAILGLDSF